MANYRSVNTATKCRTARRGCTASASSCKTDDVALTASVRFARTRRHIIVEMKKRTETPASDLPVSAVLPEPYYLRRREFLRLFGYGLAASAVLPVTMRAASAGFLDSLNPSFKLEGVKLTPEDSITSYNNFYEWGVAKDQPKELANGGW